MSAEAMITSGFCFISFSVCSWSVERLVFERFVVNMWRNCWQKCSIRVSIDKGGRGARQIDFDFSVASRFEIGVVVLSSSSSESPEK